MVQITYRELKCGEEQTVCELVRHVFNEFVAPDYEADGIEEFFRFANPAAMSTRLKAGGYVLVASTSDGLAGMLEFAPPDRIAMLFVTLRRRGIAKELLAQASCLVLAASAPVSKLTVHSSPYAESIYRRLGFSRTGDVTTEHGITYIPMEWDLRL